MNDTDAFIELSRDGRNKNALAMLNADPVLATAHSNRERQLPGASALHWAAHRNAVDVCKRLIALGPNVNDSASDWSLKPLSWDTDAGSAESAKVLLKHGADVNQDAIMGTTALHAAAMGGSAQGKDTPLAYQRTAEILIANGADVNRPTHRRRTPLKETLDGNNDAVAEILTRYGGNTSQVSS